MYIRFITGEIDEDSTFELGVFQAAYKLRRQGRLPNYEETRLTQLLEWFNTNLKKPTKFTTSKPPYYIIGSRIELSPGSTTLLPSTFRSSARLSLFWIVTTFTPR